METQMTARLAIAASDSIGESPTWDRVGNRLLWIDQVRGVIHEARPGKSGCWQETRRWELHRHVAAAVPRASGGLVVASRTEVFFLDERGDLTPFVSLDIDPRHFLLNDAKCDARGRLWIGTFSTEFRPDAALYRIDPDGTVTAVLGGLALTNGLDWSPDGTRFYLVDTLTMSIDAFDCDTVKGTIHNRQSIARLERGCGGANGLTVDDEGCLWVALTGGGEVRRYSPFGALLQRVSISIPGATSCAFGGIDCKELFITSRSGRLPDVALTIGVPSQAMESTGPEAGALFVCRPGARGKPAHAFIG
jgi:sugar lactone lactonase YvrE